MKQAKKKNHHYKVKAGEHRYEVIFQNFIQSDPPTDDRRYMKERMTPIYKYLYDKGVKYLAGLDQTLHDNGFNRDDMKGFINYCSEALIAERELGKSNADEKNILMNVLALKDDGFIRKLNSYVDEKGVKKPEKLNKDALFHDFKVQCKLLKDNCKKNVSIIQDTNIEPTSFLDFNFDSTSSQDQDMNDCYQPDEDFF